ncbi:MAG: IclR family transcriptional regulator [Advenella sp.]
MSVKEPKNTEAATVASVERALEVLNAFEGNAVSLTLAEMSSRTGLYKSTILRLADTLAKYDYLVKLEDGTYQIGPKPFLLGSRYQTGTMPAEWILPVLRNLTEQTGESASYNIMQGEFRVCLWRVDSPHLIRDHTQAGDIRPLGKGAAGKLLLAFAQPDDPQYENLRQYPVSYSFGEIEMDMAGIGTPVFGASNKLRGVLTLSGPCNRFTPEKTKLMEQVLWHSAIELTKRVGGETSHFKYKK